MLSIELAALFSRDLMRLIEELSAFPDAASLWQTAPGVTNAAGTLALHLEGNLREYVGRQLGSVDYARDRPLEFSRRGVEQQDLVTRIEAVRVLVPRVIGALSEQQLAAIYPEQVLSVPITTRQFLIHLNGHLNYHLGQIDYLRRFVTNNGALKLANL
jgi:hypothetical protein